MKPASVRFGILLSRLLWLLFLLDDQGMTWNYMGGNGIFWAHMDVKSLEPRRFAAATRRRAVFIAKVDANDYYMLWKSCPSIKFQKIPCRAAVVLRRATASKIKARTWWETRPNHICSPRRDSGMGARVP